MCGIVGAIRQEQNNVVDFLIEGLTHLEYRGYDSSGIAVVGHGKIDRVRSTGRVEQMAKQVREKALSATIGIGHTRWATHGAVTEANAHPHLSQGKIAVVHNGIIENFEQERERLQALGYIFDSQTDTEVIAHSIAQEYQQNGGQLLPAVIMACERFQGAYAIAVIAYDQPEQMVVARMGCPLLVALGEEEVFIASDVSALLSVSNKIVYLEDGDTALLSRSGFELCLDRQGQAVQRSVHYSDVSLTSITRGHYQHFMQKEIHEQPEAVINTAEVFLQEGFKAEHFGTLAPEILQTLTSIRILACGTSYYAALVAKHWLEGIARIPCDVEIASEYRYRAVIAQPKQLILTISQSGETLDTLEALKYAQSLGHQHSLSICNVRESSLPRHSEGVFYTRAGLEIGVASTKAFTTQLVALFSLAVTLAVLNHRVDKDQVLLYQQALASLPDALQQTLNLEPQLRLWAKRLAGKQSALFLGRGIHYPLALEGALKLKEITYIHAEAYPAGELKHGPLALVDEQMPVVVLAPNDGLLDKVKANIQEVAARGGELLILSNASAIADSGFANPIIRMPEQLGILSPIVHAIPLQLLAYHTALLRGTDVDKPRNLAKSVTVE